jgi:hypothetical protein
MQAQYLPDGRVQVTLAKKETLANLTGPGTWVANPLPGLIVWDALQAAKVDIAASTTPPDCPSLVPWLTALDLWQRTDASGAKGQASAQIEAAVAKLVAAGNPIGTLASRQFQAAGSVMRDELMRIAPAFGFTPADVDESLWRAAQSA